VDDIKDMFAVKKLGPENVSQIIIEVIKMVTPLTKLTKEQKASLATQVCNKLIEDIIPGKDAPMETILKAMVPDLIERLVMLDLSKLAKRFCPCMSA
jgi:NAD-dependent DNA ligase